MHKEQLEDLGVQEIYDFLLFVLYKMTDLPNYHLLSEMLYLLDKQPFLLLLQYFGGQDIHVPTIKQLNEMLIAMRIFIGVEYDNKDENVLIGAALGPGYTQQQFAKMKRHVKAIRNAIKEYDINKDIKGKIK